MELKLNGARGQVWRRKKDGTRIILTRHQDGDWGWEKLDDPRKRGVIYDYSLPQLYDLENPDGLIASDLAWERWKFNHRDAEPDLQELFLAGWNARGNSTQ